MGIACTLLWVPRLADVYGRKRLACMGEVIDTVLMAGMLVVKNYYAMLFILFGLGLAGSLRMNV